MSLSSLQLDAFLAAAKSLNFSRAAESLFITQSALSQRVKNLELTMGATLFIRDPSQIKITEIGEKLLRYCQTKDAMEDELLFNLTSIEGGELAGIVRIGIFICFTICCNSIHELTSTKKSQNSVRFCP